VRKSLRVSLPLPTAALPRNGMFVGCTLSAAADEISAQAANDRMACGWNRRLLKYLAHTVETTSS
jgi:hypothetical protein